MSDQRDLYEILGVERDAETDVIRKAYRRLARQNHPDLNPGDSAAETRFKEISKAWAVLSDDKKRQEYDEFGEISLEAGFDAEKAREVREQFESRFGATGHGGGHGVHQDEFYFGGIDDLLGRMFEREEGPQASALFRGADLEASLELDFLEAVAGAGKRLTLSRPGADGSVKTETVTVRIPPGVDESGRLRIPGKGAHGARGGASGDLWVTLRVRPHRVFRREGRNLALELPVSVREATLGAQVDVPTLDGRATLTIPPGTHGGTRLRLRGKGVPETSSAAAGDLLVRLQIKVPSELDADAKNSIEALRKFEDSSIRKDLFE